MAKQTHNKRILLRQAGTTIGEFLTPLEALRMRYIGLLMVITISS